jgi:thiamine transporter
MLCEGALCIAMSVVLSYVKLDVGPSGGSINATMIPLVLFAIRWGWGWGVGAGLVFGTLKYFLGEGFVISWVSILFDYSVAYAFVGFAGVLKGKANTAWLAALMGCAARFVVHYLSGVTVYAEWMPEEFLGMTMTTPFFYSFLYNLFYMLPSTVITLVGVFALSMVAPVRKWLEGSDLK